MRATSTEGTAQGLLGVVPTRKQPHGVCPAPGSKTGFGQSAGDFKPFLRHKGHRNKMPIRRRGSAASRKMGLRVLVHNASKPQRPAAQISFSEQEQTSGAMLSGGLIGLRNQAGAKQRKKQKRMACKVMFPAENKHLVAQPGHGRAVPMGAAPFPRWP